MIVDDRITTYLHSLEMPDIPVIEEIEKDLPKIPYVFISSVAGTGITELKDTLWKALNS